MVSSSPQDGNVVNLALGTSPRGNLAQSAPSGTCPRVPIWRTSGITPRKIGAIPRPGYHGAVEHDGWLIILDCDGVLIDSEYLAARVELEELAGLGCFIEMEEYLASTLGHTDEDRIWADWAARFGQTLPEGFGDRIRARVAAVFQAELRVIPGVERALEQIYHPKCVASGSRLDRLERNLRLTGLMRHFEGRYFSATQVPRGKPHPDLFLFAAEQLGVRPERCIVVEDSPSGVQAARAAGMHLLTFVGGTHITPGLLDALRRAGSDFTFSSMHDLPALVASLTG